jgi:hypothetical protein
LPDGVVARLLLGFALRTMETFTELYGDLTSGAISAAIVVANVRHISEDQVLDQRYSAEETPPPDAMRVPITLRSLAREVKLPFETVRRRVAALVEDGLVVWKDGGVIVPSHVLLSDGRLNNNRSFQLHFEQMLDAIVSLRQTPGAD